MIEDARLLGEISGDGETENINRGLLKLRVGHEKRSCCADITGDKDLLSLGLIEGNKVVGASLEDD